MKKIVSLILLIYLSLSINVIAADKLVLVTTEWPPYTFRENEQLMGIRTEILRELFKRNGFEVDIQIFPWKRALKMVEDGEAAAIASPIYSEERAKFLYYPSEPLGVERSIFVALKGSGIKITKVEDVKGKTVGRVRGYLLSPEFDNNPNLKIFDCDDDKYAVKLLGIKRIDIVAGEEAVMRYLSKQAGFQIEEVFVLKETPNFVAFSKKSLGEKGKMLADKFSETLKQLKQEGFIDKVRSKYF